MAIPDEGADELLTSVTERQRNVLPEDIIRYDADVDDLLWHGSRSGFGIQRAGALVIGSTIFFSASILLVIEIQHGARLALLPAIVIGTGGIRVMYKSLMGRRGRK